MRLTPAAGSLPLRRVARVLPRAWILRLAGLATVGLAAFASGAYVQDTGFFGRTVRPAIEENVRILAHAFHGLLSRPERLGIDLKQVHLDKLREQRRQALRAGILSTGEDAWVPARIRWREGTVRVKLRLKGDWTDHIDTEKWSFRVQVRGEEALFGMREFSLQHPETRNYVYEWIYHEAMRREDVLALRYDFVEVALNGRDLGVYALEEHFDKLLLEANRRREGPILKFNEETLWEDRRSHAFQDEASPSDLQSWFSSPVDAFNMKRLRAEPAMLEQFHAGRRLLEAFRSGEARTSQVFDTARLARFLALSELLGATHGAGLWHNLRFYYNPLTSRLEPIAFDGDAGSEISTLLAEAAGPPSGAQSFLGLVFADETFLAEYLRALRAVSEPGYLEALLAGLDDELRRVLAVLYREWRAYHYTPEPFRANREFIRAALRPARAARAVLRGGGGREPELEMAAIQIVPVEVLGVWRGERSVFEPPRPLLLPGKPRGLPPVPRIVQLAPPETNAPSTEGLDGLRVRCRLLGGSEIYEEQVSAAAGAEAACAWTELTRRQGNLRDFPFVTWDETRRAAFVKPGRWRLRDPLVVPAGSTLRCGPGTELDLTQSAMILSFSPVRLVGTEQAPVVVASSDGTGAGLVVLGARETSVLSRVVFRNLRSPGNGDSGPTGAVNFYESPFEMFHVAFQGSRSEDALNVVRSEFRIEDSEFSDAASDALDIDFGTGSVRRTSFLDCGNDGIDASGTVVRIEDVLVAGAGDKALSAGESSRMTIEGVRVRDAEIGLASKDDSHVEAKGLRLQRCALGLAVFRKKPEFGPASLHVAGLTEAEVGTSYLLESGSTLVLDGEPRPSNESRVRALLYGVKYGKSSR